MLIPLLGFIVLAALALGAGMLFDRQIAGWIRARWPGASAEADSGILLSLVALAAFAAGLLVMYAVR